MLKIMDKEVLHRELELIGERDYILIRIFDGKRRRVESKENHMKAFKSAIRKDRLESCQWNEYKYVMKFKDDVVDQWEVVPVVKKIEHDYRLGRLQELDNGVITRTEAIETLKKIQCSAFADRVRLIEQINFLDSGYKQYILKGESDEVIAKVDEYSDKVRKVQGGLACVR